MRTLSAGSWMWSNQGVALLMMLIVFVAAETGRAQTLTGTVTTAGTGLAKIAVNPQLNEIYVANSGSNDVTVINGATNATVTLSDPTAKFPAAVAVNPVTGLVYVVNQVSNTVSVFDRVTNQLTTLTEPQDSQPLRWP